MPKSADDLRRERMAAANAMQTTAEALNSAVEGADIAALQAAFDKAEVDFKAADVAVKRAESVEAAQATAAVAAAHVTTPATPAATVPGQIKDPAQKGIEVGFVVAALAAGKGDPVRAAAFLDKAGHSGMGAILSAGVDAAGGFTVPRPLAADMIEMLRARTVVRAAGAETFEMPAGKMRMAKQTATATASYGAETSAMPISEPVVAAVDEAFKKLTTFVPVSNDLLRMSNMNMALNIRNDMLNVMARREDIAFLRGDGTANTPRGIRNWALIGNWAATGVANGIAAVEAAINAMVNKVEDADVPMLLPGFIMRASCKNFLAGLRNATSGDKVYPSIDDKMQLKGYPIYTTSQIPVNLGVGVNETEIYFLDFSEMMIGDSMKIIVDVSSEAAYVDAGVTYSAFQRDLTLMRAISEHDFAPKHDVAIAGCNGINWFI